ncbi:large ribosomal subunit protein eL28-like [Sycon ciliatum]|uniref:large ribosomal subunit protein eL28-like n=1 Tax=Sycon ciliatum TaxID=27933 RepID=UPI0031F6B79C
MRTTISHGSLRSFSPSCLLQGLNMSADLQWLIVRKTNCFQMRRDGRNFTTEPYNLSGRAVFRDCGMINGRTVTVENNPKKKGILVGISRRSAVNRPAKRFAMTRLSKGSRRVVKGLRKNLVNTQYRPDQADIAVRRACALIRASKNKPTKAPKRRHHKKN